MFDRATLFNRSEQVTRREVTSVLGNGRKPLASIANAQAKLSGQDRATLEAREASPANVTRLTVPNSILLNQHPAGAAVTSRNAESVEAGLLVGPGVALKSAEILHCETLSVEGSVEAAITCRVIRIAEHGSFSGKVSVEIAEIHGVFEGELTAHSQLIVHSTGRVSGKVRYGKLLIKEGGELRGDTDTVSEDGAMRAKAAGEPRLLLSAVAG